MASDRIRVWPRDEQVRTLLKHPYGMAFRETIGESVEWPNDTFTQRRIKDGVVLIEDPTGPKKAALEAPPKPE